jgi:hypothetical protein
MVKVSAMRFIGAKMVEKASKSRKYPAGTHNFNANVQLCSGNVYLP